MISHQFKNKFPTQWQLRWVTWYVRTSNLPLLYSSLTHIFCSQNQQVELAKKQKLFLIVSSSSPTYLQQDHCLPPWQPRWPRSQERTLHQRRRGSQQHQQRSSQQQQEGGKIQHQQRRIKHLSPTHFVQSGCMLLSRNLVKLLYSTELSFV